MTIIFSLREGWRNFHNLGIIGLITLVSLSVTLTLTGFSMRGYMLIQEWSEGLLGRFEVEAFLDSEADSTIAHELINQVSALPYVGSVRYVSKDDAAKRFSDQFGDDVFDLLEYNPLPISLVVALKTGADPASSWERTASSLRSLEHVEDVVYQGELLAQVNRFYNRGGRGVLVAIAITLILSLIFTVLTVYSAIRSREDFIHILLLCGGSRSMARGPFVALGFYYGMVAGLFAAGISTGLVHLLKLGWSMEVDIPLLWLPLFSAVGIVIGMIGAGWAAGRRIQDI